MAEQEEDHHAVVVRMGVQEELVALQAAVEVEVEVELAQASAEMVA